MAATRHHHHHHRSSMIYICCWSPTIPTVGGRKTASTGVIIIFLRCPIIYYCYSACRSSLSYGLLLTTSEYCWGEDDIYWCHLFEVSNLVFRQDLESHLKGSVHPAKALPGHVAEPGAHVAVLHSAVRRAAHHVELLGDGAAAVREGVADHEQPPVSKPLGLFLVAVVRQGLPGHHLVRRPAKGVVPLALGPLRGDGPPGGLRGGRQPPRLLQAAGQVVRHPGGLLGGGHARPEGVDHGGALEPGAPRRPPLRRVAVVAAAALHRGPGGGAQVVVEVRPPLLVPQQGVHLPGPGRRLVFPLFACVCDPRRNIIKFPSEFSINYCCNIHLIFV
mmetsp:Transcript_28745/g.42624  ORF Transcript_28745/g.42624 Transcript_28745/m.42624 type:complete len:332 (+) Transcript_28745:124-1119(+)